MKYLHNFFRTRFEGDLNQLKTESSRALLRVEKDWRAYILLRTPVSLPALSRNLRDIGAQFLAASASSKGSMNMAPG